MNVEIHIALSLIDEETEEHKGLFNVGQNILTMDLWDVGIWYE